MRRPLVSALSLFALASSAFAVPARVESSFNNDFRFAFGEHPEAVAPGFDDAGWDRIGLPHSFSIPYFRSPKFPVGEGWYRKHFTVGDTKERRYRLDFEAAFQACDVYVNGVRAGGHMGGYTGFSVDLTPYLKTGDNVVAIRVDNRWRADLPPRSGEHVFSGGIYRDVKLIETGTAQIPRNGVRISTPEVSEAEATVTVAARYDAPVDYRAVNWTTEILDASGKIIATSSGPGTSTLKLAKPKLWSPDAPYLYTARITVSANGKASDTTTVRFGVRTFRFDKDHGFFLNGKHLWLQGANRHQDHAGWGDAIANSAHYRDAKLIKDAGFNFVRGSHYPHDPAFIDACDELGLLMWSENPFWGVGGSGPDDGTWICSSFPPNKKDQAAFEANDIRQLGEMIDDLYNHPSIIVWSMSNEPFFVSKSVLEKAKTHAADLVKATHELDPTRPAAVGGAQRSGFDKIGDIIGYNGDGARFPKPDRPSVVSEYGSHIGDRPGKYDPCWGDTKGEKPEWRAGEAIWCAFHHGSVAGDMGRMGIVDYFRLPMRQWYWYRNELAHVAPPAWPKPGKPASIRLSADRTTLTNDGTQDAHVVVTLLGADGQQVSDAPEVTLAIASGPGELPTGPSITFRHNTDIDIRDGLAAIAFRSWHGGKTTLRASSPGLPDATLELTTTGEPSWQPGYASEWQKPRAYPSKNLSDEKTSAPVLDNLGSARPARASSSEGANTPDRANDGDKATFWRPADAGPAWWRLDMENFYDLKKVAVRFADDLPHGVKLEISQDGEKWASVAETTGARGTVTLTAKTRAQGRFIRLAFGSEKPAVAEIVVSGTQK